MSAQNDVLHNFGETISLELSVPTGSVTDSTIQSSMSPAFLIIQNVGTVPVFFRLTKDGDASGSTKCTTATGNYTGILAACTSDEDGTGGTITFAGYTAGLSFCTATGTGKVNVAYSGRMGN